MGTLDRRVQEHGQRTRRHFLQLGSAAVAVWNVSPLAAADADPQLQEAVSKLEYLTPLDRAFILDKGKADVAKLPLEKLRAIGLVPDTWSLEVIPDPASNSVVEQPLSRALGNTLNWQGLMSLAPKHGVCFLHVCTCTNGQDPFHMSLWEGIPLRAVIAMTKPKDNVRRVYYQSYHAENVPPFQSSLPLRYTIAHWAVLLPGLPAGRYDLCCRTIDGNGIAQPLPRTLPRTGFNTLHVVNLVVKP